MKKMQVVLAFAALFAFSALSASTALAVELTFEPAKFLVNGVEAPAGTAVDALGEILFESVLAGAAFTCSGLFEGTVGPGGLGSIAKVFNLAGTEIKELPAAGIACTNEKTCETAVANPDKLPFEVIAEEDVQTPNEFYLLIVGSYDFTCTVIGIKIEELCEPPAPTGTAIGGVVTNLATDIEAGENTSPLATCNGNAEEGALFNIKGNLISTVNTANTLAVSL